jgi:cullin-associated NEDD8-dissociated protein 1
VKHIIVFSSSSSFLIQPFDTPILIMSSMLNSISINPSAHNVAVLLPKLKDADPDLRYMALNDLSQILTASQSIIFQSDYSTAAKTVDALLISLEDRNGEVQNMAVKCIGPFVNRLGETILCVLIDKVSQLELENVVDSSVPALALRTAVVSLPRPIHGVARTPRIQEAYNAISKSLIPRLVGYTVMPLHGGRSELPKPPKGMLNEDMRKGRDSSAMDVLIEVSRCFGSMLHDAEVNSLAKISMQVIQHDRTSHVLKKKAVVAFSTLAVYFSDRTLSQFTSQMHGDLKKKDLNRGHRRLYFTLLGSIARSIPQKFAPFLKELAPFAIQALAQAEIDRDLALMEETEERDPEADEAREAALLAVESWLSSCSDAMRPYTNDTLEIIARFLNYDPNLTHDEDDEELEEEQLEFSDDDFEEDVGGDDEDDTSWKVRRCAAKVAHVLIATRSHGDLLDDGTLYSAVAPALVSRFKEREENVRLEVLSALTLLVRITGGDTSMPEVLVSEQSVVHGSMGPPLSRKRRRGGSDASMFDGHSGLSLSTPSSSQIPSNSAMASLEKLSLDIVQGVAHLLETGPLPTKQASIGLLKDLIVSMRGGLTNYLSDTIDGVMGAFKQPVGTAASSSTLTAMNAYRVEALEFLGAVAEVQSPQDMAPYLSKVLPAIVTAMKDRYTKVSIAALNSVEHYIDLLTPPRSAGTRNQEHLALLHHAILELASSREPDQDVRVLAIHSLGMVLGRSSATPGLLVEHDRGTGMDLILLRLTHEGTRLAAARAVDAIATHARNPADFTEAWVSDVAKELGSQFRKANRSLRGTSLAATKSLATNPAARPLFNNETVSLLLTDLLPPIKASDLQLLGPALVILTALVEQDPKNLAIQEFVKPICELLYVAMPPTTLKALLALVQAMGAKEIGKPLMEALLRDVSLKASADIVGKVVGTLLVYGEGTVGVTTADFITELNSQRDEKRRCLSLSVLGEASYLMGSRCTLKPQFYMDKFDAAEEKTTQAAAAALGRAGAGNVSVYLPIILNAIGDPSTAPKQKHLLLHSIREIVIADTLEELAAHVQTLWNQVMAASQAEENRAVGAESIGRLAVVDPGTFFPQLHELLITPGSKASLRGLILSALRFTVTSDSPAAHTQDVSSALGPLLETILNLIPKETDLENRRLTLTVINAASHSRMDVLAPMVVKAVHVVLAETVIRPELVREVAMGPFKHKVDDGLDVRKVRFRTGMCFEPLQC